LDRLGPSRSVLESRATVDKRDEISVQHRWSPKAA
jgi:hypothetical protein